MVCVFRAPFLKWWEYFVCDTMNRHWVTISWGHVLPVFCLLSDYRITTWSVRLTGYSHTHTVRMRVRLCQTRQTQSRTITASQTPMPTPIPRCLQIRTCPAPVSETDPGVSAYRILSSTNSGQQHILRITLSAYIAGLIFNCWCFFFFKGYELFAFISHMGASTMSGHYVCHIKKEGRYADYNVCYLCTF